MLPRISLRSNAKSAKKVFPNNSKYIYNYQFSLAQPDHSIVTAGNLILDNLGTQVHKNHCDFHS